MSLDRLEGFALEKVFDPEGIAAPQHPYPLPDVALHEHSAL